MQADGSSQSLTRRLLWVMITTLSAVAVALGAVGTILIDRVVEQSFDKLLGASTQEIGGTLATERGSVVFDVPPSAFGMLENEQRDSIFYRVSQGRQLLTGYADLPAISASDARSGERVFDYADYKGQRIRIAAEPRHLPGMSEPVVVEVAQTLRERHELALVMKGALYLVEASFVVIAGVLVWPTLKWGLRPVNHIREELEARPSDHANFAPLDLRYAPSELAGLVGGFNHLLGRLEGAVGGMRQFIADASHQMRTPLAVLKIHLAILSRHVPQDSPGGGSLVDIDGAVGRLESLLTRLISLARADEAARGGIARSRVDLRAVIAQVVSDLVPLAAQRDINISIHGEQRPVWVHAEPAIVAEILTNLVENAIRYNRSGGAVSIHIQEDPGSITVSVEDDGPGIPEAERQHVFERFYRLQRDQTQLGSGLGLAIVKTLSEAVRAQVSMEAPPSGRGLRVSVRFDSAAAGDPDP